jgi:hypothetical protein
LSWSATKAPNGTRSVIGSPRVCGRTPGVGCRVVVERIAGERRGVSVRLATASAPRFALCLVPRRRPPASGPGGEGLSVLELDGEPANLTDQEPWLPGVVLGDGIAKLGHEHTFSYFATCANCTPKLPQVPAGCLTPTCARSPARVPARANEGQPASRRSGRAVTLDALASPTRKRHHRRRCWLPLRRLWSRSFL